jgi:hypothetical protein
VWAWEIDSGTEAVEPWVSDREAKGEVSWWAVFDETNVSVKKVVLSAVYGTKIDLRLA